MFPSKRTQNYGVQVHETVAVSWRLIRLHPRNRPSTKCWPRNALYRVYRNPFRFQFTAVSALWGVVRTATHTTWWITAKEALTYVTGEGNLSPGERSVKHGCRSVVCTLTTFGSRRYKCHANVIAQVFIAARSNIWSIYSDELRKERILWRKITF
jgi:hypothetical protein